MKRWLTMLLTKIFETKATAVANVWLFTGMYTFVYLQVLLLGEALTAAVTFVRSFA